MADFTEAQYAAAIPRCCSRQTLREHVDMMLCWGLAAAIRDGHPMDCTGCQLRNPEIPSDRRTVNVDSEERESRYRDALLRIKRMTDADDPESYRCDDREGCLDTVFAVASEALLRSD